MANSLSRSFGLVAGSLTAIVLSSQVARAADFDFSGTFDADNDVLMFDFTVDLDSSVTVFSSSWDDGGLDPILSIWDTAGNLIQEQDDGENIGSTSSNGVFYDHGVWDSYYTEFLTAGDYTAVVTQFDNFANGTSLSDGFSYDGPGNENFTATLGSCSNGQFCGVFSFDDNRTNEWVFHLTNVGSATVIGDDPESVPEPASLLGLAAIGAVVTGSALKKKAAA